MEREPFLSFTIARRIALRGVLLGALLALIPLLMGAPRLAGSAFMLGLCTLGPWLLERAAERRPFGWLRAAAWSSAAALLAWVAIVGVALHGHYVQAALGRLPWTQLERLDPRFLVFPILPAWVVGISVFHRLLRLSGALGCGALIALELGLLLVTLFGSLAALRLLEGETGLVPVATAAVVALGITAATAVGALTLIGFTVAVDALAERRA